MSLGKPSVLLMRFNERFFSRPMPDEALFAVLWEYKDRGQKGYDMTERMFELFRGNFPEYDFIGPERAGRDVILGEIFDDYPNPDRPADFIIKKSGKVLAIGFARYDSDRGGAQEDDRTGGYLNASREMLEFSNHKNLNLKVIFVNDGPGLLLGSMWDDYSYLEETSNSIRTVTLRMLTERITKEWLEN